MPGINYAINGCSPLRTSPGEKTLLEEKHCCSCYSRLGNIWQFEKENY